MTGERSRTTARRTCFAIVSLLALGACTPSDAPKAAKPYDVVLVSIDTLRPDHLACHGYGKDTSPAIDRFRRDAVLFREAIAQAPSTLLSHASILTSLWPHHHGVSHSRKRALAEELSTVTEVLKEAGYRTASFNGGGQMDAAFGLGQGFDVYRSVRGDAFSDIVERGLRWLEENAGSRFFLFLHSYEVHHPYTPREEYLRLFDGDYDGPLPGDISVSVLRSINRKRTTIDERDLEYIESVYDGEIRSMDDAFATLIEGLKARGLYEKTLVVFTSDHGEEFGEHGWVGWHSHTLYDELLRVPLLVKLPGSLHAGATVREQVRSIDIAPTILATLGLEIPDQFAGIDLTRVVAGENVGPLLAISRMDAGRTATRTEKWKLYRRRLYDLEKDPGETVDVAAEHPEVVERLVREVEAELATRAPATARRAEPGAATVKQLRALGYVQ